MTSVRIFKRTTLDFDGVSNKGRLAIKDQPADSEGSTLSDEDFDAVLTLLNLSRMPPASRASTSLFQSQLPTKSQVDIIRIMQQISDKKGLGVEVSKAPDAGRVKIKKLLKR